MDRQVKVSFIIAAYNVEEYILKCFESIETQECNFNDIEVIVVDDGSTDLTKKYCDEWAEGNFYVRVVHKENGGLVSARKVGLSVASGDYIGFIDGDDCIENGYFKKVLMLLNEYDVDLLYFGMYVNGGLRYNGLSGCMTIDNNEFFLVRYFLNPKKDKMIGASLCAKIIRKELIGSVYSRLPDGQSQGEDTLATFELLLQCNSIYFSEEGFYKYTNRRGSITKENGVRRLLSETSLYRELCETAKKYGCSQDVFRAIEMKYLNRVKGNLQLYDSTDVVRVQYRIKNVEKFYDKKVIVCGAGNVGKDYYAQLSCFTRCSVVGWIDKRSDTIHFNHITVLSYEQALELEFDYIIVATKFEGIAKEMINELISCGVNHKKIIWEYPIENA